MTPPDGPVVNYACCADCGAPIGIQSVWTSTVGEYLPTYHWTERVIAYGKPGGWISVDVAMGYPQCHARPHRFASRWWPK